ncbi:unnamed protein product [Porites lobata]|uniref:Uncharacterized protein n=1 Tax=Porites lobata TaxID=104759 RepID=A0ABN8NR50_9CNID|nr:unnamed protein product [Porites lobata]
MEGKFFTTRGPCGRRDSIEGDGPDGVKEIDDFGETSRINAKFLGDSVEFDAKKHKVRCRRNCLKGIGSKSKVSTGPPTVPKLSAFRLDTGPNGSANFSCKANQLNFQQMASYKWKWMFINETEVMDVYGKYKILSTFSSPNSCQQTMGAVYLRVENLTTEDHGTYKCVLFENEVEIAAEDVPFYEYVSSNVPPRPEIVKNETFACGRKIEVEWKPIEGSGVTGYELIISSLKDGSDEKKFNLSSKDHSKKLDVQSSNLYEIQIRAKNSLGHSFWTKRQLETKAGVPTSFEVLAEPQGCYAALSWNIPSYNSCPITRYTVHYRQSNQLIMWQTTFIERNLTNYRLRLNCSSTYKIMVLAWNDRGSSIKDAKVLAVTTEEGVPLQQEPPGVKQRQCGVFEVTWNPPSLDSGGGPNWLSGPVKYVRRGNWWLAQLHGLRFKS